MDQENKKWSRWKRERSKPILYRTGSSQEGSKPILYRSGSMDSLLDTEHTGIFYTVHCSLYTLHGTLHTVHCTLYSVQDSIIFSFK